MFERPDTGSRALLVALGTSERDYEESLAELRELTSSACLEVAGVVGGGRNRIDPSTYAGSGKVAEIAALRAQLDASVVIFNNELSPVQERNLERALECRVVDRTTLILDIFAQRARSHEGKLQVELAQLDHLATRLVRGWTHLERQKGGIGLRGPGETQLETDRRLLGKRVKVLKEKLQKVERQRATQRRSRARGAALSVSLVGYTNAGKSTLFNALTHAGTYAADQLFATLDTTSRRMFSPAGRNIVLSDTVGFIRDLPHELVAAFRATLTETAQADLLLHVVDFASSDRDRQVREVNRVLAEIGADAVPQILVCNKIDRVSIEPKVVRDDLGDLTSVSLSALTGDGVDLLRATLDDFFDRAERDPASLPDEGGDTESIGMPLAPVTAVVDADTWTGGPLGAATGAGSR
ncbi:MAG: GTPase HflX [bacterium]|jgi:GTP-binding protein HflX|nr:GTPase HflX [Betaproteobacteria bacterium]